MKNKNSKEKKTMIARILAAVLAAIMVISLLAGLIPVHSHAAKLTSDKLEDLKKQLEAMEEDKNKIKGLPKSLGSALKALERDHDFLTAGGVFPEELIRSFIKAKRAECAQLSTIPHPAEFERYYNL